MSKWNSRMKGEIMEEKQFWRDNAKYFIIDETYMHTSGSGSPINLWQYKQVFS